LNPPRTGTLLPPRPLGGDHGLPFENINSGKEGSIFEMEDPRLGVRLLFLSRRQASGMSLVLSFPLAQVSESARGAMLFLSLSSALALVMGAFLSYLLAKGVTRPFSDLVRLSRSIASLDFSRRFVSKRNDDEVEALGGAMNELSDSLQQALAELKESNDKLREDVQREKRVDAMRREFISNVSHELKTPLALILGYAEGIMEGVPGDLASRDAYLAVIIDEAKKMNEQVRDLLELSQIESGVLPLKIEDFDLRELVYEALSSFDMALDARGIRPELSLEECFARGDRRMLGRAFVNYLSNAVSHIDDRLVLSIALVRRGVEAELSIFNSGAWIPERSLELIWNSYYKTDPARQREFGGTGLGLAIVRGIIERHGGACSVENVAEGDAPDSRPGGVRFAFTVPIDGPR
jgi:signal transduction histidine kinase